MEQIFPYSIELELACLYLSIYGFVLENPEFLDEL